MTLAKEKSLLAANCPESVSKEELYAFYAHLASYCAALCTLSEDERKCVVSNVLAELSGYENDRQEFGTLLLRDIIRRQIHLFCKDKSESELLADDEWENIQCIICLPHTSNSITKAFQLKWNRLGR